MAIAPGIVLGIVQDLQGQVLIVHRMKEVQISEGKTLSWVFPGGKIEPGETKGQAVAREVMEETGYEVEPQTIISERRHPQTGVLVSYLLCRVKSIEPYRVPSMHEIRESKWVEPDDLFDYFTTDLDPQVAKVLGLSKTNP